MRVIEKIASWENLLEAYEKASYGKRERKDAMLFSMNLEENLLKIQHELLSGTYRTGIYHVFYIKEPKKRMIMALPFYDRVVQWAVYLVLNPYFDRKMICHSYACREGKGQLKAAERVQYWSGMCAMRKSDSWYLKMDISKFFYRIDHSVLIKILERYFHKEQELMAILRNIIDCDQVPFGLDRWRSVEDTDLCDMRYDVGLPIGNLLSQLFANIYLNELDQYVKHTLKAKYYVRYMDDVVIIMNDLEKLKRTRDMIISFAGSHLKLDFNSKTTIGKVENGITFVGCRIFPGYRRVTSSAKKKIKRGLLREARKYARGETTLIHAISVLMSYYAVLDRVESDRLMEWISQNFVLQRNRRKRTSGRK